MAETKPKKRKATGRPFVKGDPRIGQKKKGCIHASTVLRKHIKDEEVAKMVVEHARAGERDFIVLICHYLWGKPVQLNINENNDKSEKPKAIEVNFVEVEKEIIANVNINKENENDG